MNARAFSFFSSLIVLLGLFALRPSPVAARPPGQAAGETGHNAETGHDGHRIFTPLVTKPAATIPTIHSFTANPATIQPGGAATLSWQVAGATSLSISPDPGPVGGGSVVVRPAATTTYTLTASNAIGSATARTTITVSGPQPTSAFFLQDLDAIDRATANPTVRVDKAGGLHVVFTPQTTTSTHPTRPVYYAYCPANCTSSNAFTLVSLGDGVDFAALSLTPDGRPRILARVPVQSGAVFVFQYWACDTNCASSGSWNSAVLGYAYARQTGWVEPFIHSFALDAAGQPRFVYYDAGQDYEDPHTGAYFAGCNAGCLDPANWTEMRLVDDDNASDFHLAYGAAGGPRLAYVTYDDDNGLQQVAYAECDQNCGAGGNWRGGVLADTVSASVTSWATISLAVTSDGKPRLAIYSGTGLGGSLPPNGLYYLACNAASCAGVAAWSGVRLNVPETQGEEGVALALDGQDRPRIAYHAPMAAGLGLHYAWCDANCVGSAAAWSSGEVEDSAAANAVLPIPPWPGCPFPQCNPPVPPCTMSSWDVGLNPSLAIDGAGNARVAYDAFHRQGGGCGTFTDAKLVRFAGFSSVR